jgi:hypothetical protein
VSYLCFKNFYCLCALQIAPFARYVELQLDSSGEDQKAKCVRVLQEVAETSRVLALRIVSFSNITTGFLPKHSCTASPSVFSLLVLIVDQIVKDSGIFI